MTDGPVPPEPAYRPPPLTRDSYFRASVWATVVVLLFLSPTFLAILGWFTDAYQDTTQATEVSHRLHEVMFGVLFTIALVGAISLLLRPDRSIAGLFQLSITILTLSIVVASTVGWDWGLLLYLVPVAAVVVLRPKQVPIRSGPVWWWAVLLTFIALLPFVSEAQGHLDRALGGAQNHTTHWSAMAAVTLVLLALGVVVALRITGYRVTGFSIAGAGIGYGAASLAFPFDASSHRTGYALLLIIWGLAWLAALRYADRPLRATSEKQLVPVLRTVGFVFLAFVVSVAWDGNDDQPNVPHRPDPNNPMVVAADVDRETCLGCHATKTAGAPRVPHDPTDTCEGDGCWDGRTDCAGCHRIDPDLPGPVQAVATGPPRPVSFKTPAGESIVPVSPDDLAVLAAIGVER